MSRLTVVVGAQFGSEGKGAVAAAIAKQDRDAALGERVAIRVAGPNAGHTVYDHRDRRYALRQLPVAAVVDPHARLVIAAGSEVDPEVLQKEIAELESDGHRIGHRLVIDSQATLLSSGYAAQENAGHDRRESLVHRVGSTGKGVGAARADRIMRGAKLVRDDPALAAYCMPDTAEWIAGSYLRHGGRHRITVEGAQGYGLGLHAGHYPYCTSSDCRAIDFLSMAGLSPWLVNEEDFRVVLVARPYVIRVAGNSGPLYEETSWSELGLPVERTTVTNKVRRVGQWDRYLFELALRANGDHRHVWVALTMLDQRFPEIEGVAQLDGRPEYSSARQWVTQIEHVHQARVAYVGTGPTTQVWLRRW